MASRQISIKITLDNQQAINDARAQAIALRSLGDETQRQTQLQDGLTNSFIKGNLAARAISVGYNLIKDAFQTVVKSAADLEFTMAKISAISGESATSVSSLGDTIQALALTSNKSAVDIAKAALEMNKIGLSNPQVKLLLGSVVSLSTALDEDLVKSGETVVNILNAYGDSVLEGRLRTEELAFTVGASALTMDSFGTAFSYVGATAKLAGVTFEDLTAAMDVLSNAGIKSSSIGTQLRRIFADLSNENSKASKAIGGTIESLGGLIPAMEALKRVTPEGDAGVAFLTEKFGRQATSVAAILALNTDEMRKLSQETGDASGRLAEMQDTMNDTFLAKWEHFSNITKTMGEGPMFILKSYLSGINDALDGMIGLYERAAKAAGDFMNAAETKKSVAAGGGFGDLLVGDQKNLAEQSKLVDDLLKKSKEFDGDGASKNGLDTLDRIKTDFEVFKTFGGTFDFKDANKQLKAVADEMLRIGDAKDAIKVMRELQEINREQHREGKYKSQKPEIPLMEVLKKDFIPEDFGAPKGSAVSALFDKIGNDMNANKSPETKASQGLTKYFASLKESIEPAQHAVDAMKLSMDALAQSSNIVGDSIVNAFLGHKDAFSQFQDAFGNMAKKFVSDLIAMELRILAFKAAISIFSALMPAAAPLSAPALGGDGFGNVLSMATMSASGYDGMVRQPTMFVAGDGAPEHVTVTPRSRANSGSDTQAMVININGDVYDYDKFQHKVAQAQDKNRKGYV